MTDEEEFYIEMAEEHDRQYRNFQNMLAPSAFYAERARSWGTLADWLRKLDDTQANHR